MKLYTLIATNGSYIDDYGPYADARDAQKEMEKQYARVSDGEHDEDFSEMSYLGTDYAIFYNDGEDIYAWKVICTDTDKIRENGEENMNYTTKNAIIIRRGSKYELHH